MPAGAVLVFLLCGSALVENQQWLATSLSIAAAAFGFGCLLVVAVLSRRAAAGILGGMPLRMVSRLSYALYLVHYPLIAWTQGIAESLAGTASGPAFLFAFGLAYLGFSFAFAVLLHLAVEKPFLLIKDKL